MKGKDIIERFKKEGVKLGNFNLIKIEQGFDIILSKKEEHLIIEDKEKKNYISYLYSGHRFDVRKSVFVDIKYLKGIYGNDSFSKKLYEREGYCLVDKFEELKALNERDKEGLRLEVAETRRSYEERLLDEEIRRNRVVVLDEPLDFMSGVEMSDDMEVPEYVEEMIINSKKPTRNITREKCESERGVYGIYLNDELVYIGMTTRSFKSRWNEHMKCVSHRDDNPQQNYLYKAMRKKGVKIEFKAMCLANKGFTKKEIHCMEYALISALKPKFNYCGVKVEYDWK